MASPSAKTAQVPARSRKEFVRTEVPFIERSISVLVVCFLAGIGCTVWWKGQHFDPALYSLRSEALKSTSSDVEGKSGTLRSAGGGEPGEVEAKASAKSTPATPAAETGEGAPAESAGGNDGHGGTAAPAKLVKGEPMELNIASLKPMGATEFYSAETLFEKIDGRSGAYTGFNCQGLRFRSFNVPDTKSSYVDVYEYRMDAPANAFGIFALERDPKGKKIDFAPDGYAGEMGFFYRQGVYYIQVLASDQDARTLKTALEIARNRAKAFPEDNAGLDARRRLPATGLVPETIAFVQDNAQGQEFLKNVFQAKYLFEGATVPFFIMVTTPEEAAAGWKKYHDFCARFGKAETLPDVNGAKLFQAASFGKFRVIFQRGGEIGGAYDATDGVKARGFIESYLKGAVQ